jgi:hypothetical protein
MVGDFHAANRFGVLVFGDENGKAPEKPGDPKPAEPAATSKPGEPAKTEPAKADPANKEPVKKASMIPRIKVEPRTPTEMMKAAESVRQPE